jgi:hypothetical protein
MLKIMPGDLVAPRRRPARATPEIALPRRHRLGWIVAAALLIRLLSMLLLRTYPAGRRLPHLRRL